MALNYYLLLGIPPDADQRRIRAAYRSLAKRFHPDANRGSEAAAELFRQINEAYRVLSDTEAREKYHRKLQKEQQPVSVESRPKSEPDEKFNNFLNSLLDAIFGPLEQPPRRAARENQAPPKQTAAPKKRRKPAFSFYFHLALEKQNAPYELGKDGIYRPPPISRKTTGQGNGFGRMPRGSLVLVLLTALLSLLKP